MTTFKQCAACAQIVEWAPPKVERFEHAAIVPWECAGGNEPRLCPYSVVNVGGMATADGQLVPDGTTGVVIHEVGGMWPAVARLQEAEAAAERDAAIALLQAATRLVVQSDDGIVYPSPEPDRPS